MIVGLKYTNENHVSYCELKEGFLLSLPFLYGKFIYNFNIYPTGIILYIPNTSNKIEDIRRVMLHEEMKKHNNNLASTAREAGVVDSHDYAVFQNFGNQGLYGGLGMKEIHKKKGLKKSQKILDHMGS